MRTAVLGLLLVGCAHERLRVVERDATPEARETAFVELEPPQLEPPSLEGAVASIGNVVPYGLREMTLAMDIAPGCQRNRDCFARALTLTGTLTGVAGTFSGTVKTDTLDDNSGGTISVTANISATGNLATDASLIITGGGALTFSNECDSTASPGSAVCNQGAGRFSIASGASTATITNSQVTTSTIVQCTMNSANAGCTTLLSCVPGSGSFVATVNSNCTVAAANVGWSLVK